MSPKFVRSVLVLSLFGAGCGEEEPATGPQSLDPESPRGKLIEEAVG